MAEVLDGDAVALEQARKLWRVRLQNKNYIYFTFIQGHDFAEQSTVYQVFIACRKERKRSS